MAAAVPNPGIVLGFVGAFTGSIIVSSGAEMSPGTAVSTGTTASSISVTFFYREPKNRQNFKLNCCVDALK